MKKTILGLFLLLSAIQIAVPLSMISKREYVLNRGEQFMFKTAPVDPYDAFRGRYVALQIEENVIPEPKNFKLQYGDKVYAPIIVDKNGFAKFSAISISRPKGIPYMRANIGSVYKGNVHLSLPVDRYYMAEGSAPAAERIYREHASREKQDAYILVRVKSGFAVIEGLYVGGRKIEELVRQNNPNAPK